MLLSLHFWRNHREGRTGSDYRGDVEVRGEIQMSNRIAATVLFAGVIVASAAANAQPSDVSFAGSTEDGGLGGEFVFLNSDGGSPFLTPSSWSSWFVPDAVFSATLGGTTYSNTNDDGDIVYYGYPDTTTYGETFVAPGICTDFSSSLMAILGRAWIRSSSSLPGLFNFPGGHTPIRRGRHDPARRPELDRLRQHRCGPNSGQEYVAF